MMAAESHNVPAVRLEEFISESFQAVGVPKDDANSVAQLMTRIDLRGLTVMAYSV